MWARRATSFVQFLLVVILILAASPAIARADTAPSHIVRRGETLATIAAQYHTTAQAIARLNGLSNPDLIWPGQRLSIPSAYQQNGPIQPIPSRGRDEVTYTVRSGDTLANIAARFQISTAAIVRANGLAIPDLLYPGLRLTIPTSASQPGFGEPTSGSGTRFVISISQQRCWLYQDEAMIGDWSCCAGRAGSPTVPGSYRIQSKMPMADGATWDLWLPNWLGLYYAGGLENGIHGLPVAKGTGARTWAGLVGTPITYGCVMLDDAHAQTLYRVAYVGMPVTILP